MLEDRADEVADSLLLDVELVGLLLGTWLLDVDRFVD